MQVSVGGRVPSSNGVFVVSKGSTSKVCYIVKPANLFARKSVCHGMKTKGPGPWDKQASKQDQRERVETWSTYNKS